METLEQLFRSRLDAFIERTGISLTRLGREALGDPNLMRQIALGRSPTLRTVDRIQAFMASYERPRRGAPDPPRRRRRRPRRRANRSRRGRTMTEPPGSARTAPRTRLLRRAEVEARTGLSRSSIYLRMSQGRFPRPVRLGVHAVRWIESEIEEWIRKRVTAGRASERPSST